MKLWLVTCNGGPNNTTLGKEVKGFKKALGVAESFQRTFSCEIFQIEMIDPNQRTLEQIPVNSELEAGRTPVRDVYGNFIEE